MIKLTGNPKTQEKPEAPQGGIFMPVSIASLGGLFNPAGSAARFGRGNEQEDKMITRGTIYGKEGHDVYIDDKPLSPEASLKLRDYSPVGFSWGNIGLGSAQLALAILLEISGDEELAIALHDQFKRDVVSQLPTPEFSLPVVLIWEWMEACQGKERLGRLWEKAYDYGDNHACEKIEPYWVRWCIRYEKVVEVILEEAGGNHEDN